MKGQTSFELIFVALVIMTASVYFTNLYIQTTETTTLVGVTKNEMLKLLNNNENENIIEKISIEKIPNNTQIKITILTTNKEEIENLLNQEVLNKAELNIKKISGIENEITIKINIENI